jgi:DNA-binding transcriptional regulator YdaS (Cro superfamily)
MLLKDWLRKKDISAASFAKALKLNPPTIYRLLQGKGKNSPGTGVLIEAVTRGEVTRGEAIYPEDYVDENGKYSPVPRIHFELSKGINFKTWTDAYISRTKKREGKKRVKRSLCD